MILDNLGTEVINRLEVAFTSSIPSMAEGLAQSEIATVKTAVAE
jgi:hypothetical protein